MKVTHLFLRPLAAVASGLGMAALFPPHGYSQLVWIVFLPLLFALWSLGEGKRKRKAFGFGLLTGLAFFLPNLAWLRTVSDAGWAALSIYLALFPAIWALFAATWGNPWRGEEKGFFHVPRHALACALVWTGLELLRGWLFTGFGWNTYGTAFSESLVFAQAADLLGATGLSILPIFVQAVLLQVFVRRVSQFHSSGLRKRLAFTCVIAAMFATYGYGMWRIFSARKVESIRLNALLVQLNIPQEASRQLVEGFEIHLRYEDETLEGLGVVDGEVIHSLNSPGSSAPKPDWVIWPETALTGRILRMDDGDWATAQENWTTLERIRQGGGDFTLMLGLTELEAEWQGDEPIMKKDARAWNSLAVMPADGSLQTFRKHHLVIFGEYIPLVEKLPFLAKIYEQQSGAKYSGAFSQGESLEPLPVAIGDEKVGVIPSVCFEDTVPRLLRKFVREGPQIIVNITNDGWFKESPGAAQHFANARFRAIELRRPMIRCANTGVSAAISSTGSTMHPEGGRLQELRDENGSHFTRGHLLTQLDIPVDPPTTLYARIGDLGVIVLTLIGFLMGAIPALRERRQEVKEA
ncbi:apolipoprotein N-acyltransferase [Luteolibacter flavescens]|uniref:Apolipoprotein N-acyltransferase n=1 Tax=Luteolibacter flavescens TaxID=1859460 RepID=A0ABT3FQR3_9BACT|nr:apolipoprotein N-acyltransferase [Luteolibacter flavescens]MCW1885905.1 apolipoprotein N-acyltransferase [Luteolibacter flavescens]